MVENVPIADNFKGGKLVSVLVNTSNTQPMTKEVIGDGPRVLWFTVEVHAHRQMERSPFWKRTGPCTQNNRKIFQSKPSFS